MLAQQDKRRLSISTFKEQLEARLESLKQDKAGLEATINAFSGAIEQAEWTLAQLEQDGEVNATDGEGDTDDAVDSPA